MRRVFTLCLSAGLTLLVITLLTFLLMKAVPGGPFDGDKALPPEVMAQLNAKFHLDLPPAQQFVLYLKNIFLAGDLGPSTKYIGRNVQEIIAESLPVSLELGIYALVIAIVTGVGLGVLAARFRGTFLDSSAMFLAISGVSLPSFLVATLAIWLFGQQLGWLPVALWEDFDSKIMPSVVLGLRPAAIIARMTRSSVLEIWHMDFVRTARAKGLGDGKILFVHVLRNALVPLLAILGPIAASVLTGSFVIEFVFSIPGLGSHFVEAVTNRDYPLVMGVTLLFATVLVAINLFIDILFGVVDPRISA